MDSILGSALTWLAAESTQEAPPGGGMLPLLLMMGAIFFLYYMIIGRGQAKERKKREQMLDELAKGDSVVTSGGIHGTVESVNKEKQLAAITIAPKVTIHVNRAAVAQITKKKSGKSDEEDARDK